MHRQHNGTRHEPSDRSSAGHPGDAILRRIKYIFCVSIFSIDVSYIC